MPLLGNTGAVMFPILPETVTTASCSGAVGVGWLEVATLALAGGELYRTMMSKEPRGCETMAEVLNRDTEWDSNLR